MGKIRVAELGDEQEAEQKRKADARRQTKQSKKKKDEPTEAAGEVVQPQAEEGEVKVKKVSKEKKIRVRGKQYVEKSSLVDKTKLYPVSDAVELVKRTSFTKFDGTVELHVNLNTASLGDKKDYRGSVSLPHGKGK